MLKVTILSASHVLVEEVGVATVPTPTPTPTPIPVPIPIPTPTPIPISTSGVVDIATQYPAWQAVEGSRAGQPLISGAPNSIQSFAIPAGWILPASLASGGSGTYAVFAIFQGFAGIMVEVSNVPFYFTPNPNSSTPQRTSVDQASPKFYAMGPNTDVATQAANSGTPLLPQPDNGNYYINVKLPSVVNLGDHGEYYLNFWRS